MITDRSHTHQTIAAHRGRARLGIARYYNHTGWVVCGSITPAGGRAGMKLTA